MSSVDYRLAPAIRLTGMRLAPFVTSPCRPPTKECKVLFFYLFIETSPLPAARHFPGLSVSDRMRMHLRQLNSAAHLIPNRCCLVSVPDLAAPALPARLPYMRRLPAANWSSRGIGRKNTPHPSMRTMTTATAIQKRHGFPFMLGTLFEIIYRAA